MTVGRCTCGRRSHEVSAHAPEVCNGCDNFPWNCRCPPLTGRRRTTVEETVRPSLEPDEEEF